MEEVGKDPLGANIRRGKMAIIWSTKDILGWDKRELLVCYHRLKHYYFKSLLRISKRGIIPRKLSKIRKIPPCVTCLFGNYHKRPWRTKDKN